MRLHSSDFVAGAASARGVAIVIDVFRACSLIAHALAAGAVCEVLRIDALSSITH
jgi:phosphosulfolactate phosphohydrolase-like enzyme